MSKNEDLSINNFIDNDFDRLVELNKTSYPDREISNVSYLEWEYLQNPGGNALITTGEINQKIVSQYIVLPRTYCIEKKLLSGSLSVNTLTHINYRGRDFFKKLADSTFSRCAQEKIFFTIGFPNNISHPIISKKEIFETAGNLTLLLKAINPLKILFKYIKNRNEITGKEIELNISDKTFSKSPKISFFNLQTDSFKYEIFLQKFNDEKQNVTFRSLQFLKWRYLDIPNRKYHLLKLEANNEIEAIAVFRAKYIYGIRCGILIDLITLENLGDVKALLSTICEIALNNKLDLIFTTVPSHSFEFSILIKSRFYSIPQFFLPQKLAFIVKRHLPSCPEAVTNFRKWFLTFGDYDIF